MSRGERIALRGTNPGAAGLARLEAALDGAISGVEVLHGGISASVHGFTLTTDGVERGLILKRFIPSDPVPPREWDGLRVAMAVSVPTPEPVAFDPTGEWFDMPALVMSRLPGTATYTPRDLDTWVSELARMLVAVHSTPLPDEPPVEFARPHYWTRWQRPAGEMDARMRKVADVIEVFRPIASELLDVFSHRDFHPQNVLWDGDFACGVIDWPNAGFAPRGLDLASCRMAMMFAPGGDSPDRLLAAYRRRSGEPIPEIAYWDVIAGLEAMQDGMAWATAAQHIAPGITGEDIVSAGERFVDEALARL